MTRLESFIREHKMKPAQLARVAAISRAHLGRLRKGEDDPSRRVMVRLMMACRMILNRRVELGELFDLTDAGL